MKRNDLQIYLCRTVDCLAAGEESILIADYLTVIDIEQARLISDPVKRRLYLQAHCFKRFVLSEILQIAPASINFYKNSYGKPFIANGGFQEQLFFNLSYSPSIIGMVISDEKDIGIDVEKMQMRDDLPLIEGVVFSKREKDDASEIIDPEERNKNFYKKWVIKEAYLKAIGTGLSIEPSTLTIKPLDEYFTFTAASEASKSNIIVGFELLSDIALAYAFPNFLTVMAEKFYYQCTDGHFEPVASFKT
jgi:4'-phosphopantetheinyl transferase